MAHLRHDDARLFLRRRSALRHLPITSILRRGCSKSIPRKYRRLRRSTSPDLRKLPDGSYEAYYVAEVFEFNPARLTIPVGSKVTFYVTSADVVHGFFIPETDINMMAVPGWVNQETHTFTHAGEYLFICHEYCGIDHQDMFAKIEVR